MRDSQSFILELIILESFDFVHSNKVVYTPVMSSGFASIWLSEYFEQKSEEEKLWLKRLPFKS